MVDVMIAPVRESRGKPIITSTPKAVVELKAATGERNEYAALQTSWAEWCREHLDQSITRGLRRELTGRQHLSPETHDQVMDKAREALQARVENLRGALQATELSWDEQTSCGTTCCSEAKSAVTKRCRTYEPPGGEIDRTWVEHAALEGDSP